jgi:AcrR family transcriptional regulator
MYLMARPVKGRRSYDSTSRQEQAGQNRARILDAARARFLEDGYAATTITAIAHDAGLSVETVYKAFGNKAGLLKTLFDIAIVGDDEPVPLMQREVVRRNMAEPNPRKKLQMYAEFYIERAERSMPFQLLAREAAASDPAATAVWEQMEQERLVGMTHFARHLHDEGHLRSGVTVEEARDLLWTFISAEMWELLVIKRGWPPERYGQWMAHLLIAALLPLEPPEDGGNRPRSTKADRTRTRRRP